MINIEPPGVWEWIVLVVVGALAGAVNTLRSFAERGTTQAVIVGAVEGATALFVTVTTFLILHSFLPVLAGINVPSLGLIGLAGAIAHIGLRQTIRMVLRVVEQEKTPVGGGSTPC